MKKEDALKIIVQSAKVYDSNFIHDPKYNKLRYLAKGITPETLIIPDRVNEKISSIIIKDLGDREHEVVLLSQESTG